jgi:rhamnogalacturonan endolyase
MQRLLPFAAIIVVLAGGTMAAEEAAPVTSRQNAQAIVLDNGIVSITIDKASGDVTSMIYRPAGAPISLGDGAPRAMYWDMDATPDKVSPMLESSRPKADYSRPFQCMNFVRVNSSDAGMTDVVVDAGPFEWFPFHAQYHYVLRRGQSGFYAYAVYRHEKGMPAATLEQTRFVIRAENKGAIFTDQVVDDARKGPPPSSKIVDTIQDATYRLADGTAYTKYDNTQFAMDYTAQGMAGHGVGLWLVWPSVEFGNGGPLKQELTVQIDNIMQAMFQGEHFGGAPIKVADDESWSKCFGPVLVYMNHGDTTGAMWTDAKKQAAEQRRQWPLSWLHDDAYPQHRGAATGRVVLQNGGNASTNGAWVILASQEQREEGVDWAMRSKGYEFWTRADSRGRFSIANVRPGRYTLFVSGADQFEDFEKRDVVIEPDGISDLGNLHWSPLTHGKRIWQIGVADRSTGEFHDGAEPVYRNYDAFLNYFNTFPHDVNFVIGQSRESRDWEYAQWNWYNEKPAWTVRFSLAAADIPARGKATLTLGIASAQPAGNVVIGVNAQNVAAFALPKTGAAGYRSGAQDSQYIVKYVSFDAALLKSGQNEITLGQEGMEKFSAAVLAKEKRPSRYVMYDAVRLEMEAE